MAQNRGIGICARGAPVAIGANGNTFRTGCGSRLSAEWTDGFLIRVTVISHSHVAGSLAPEILTIAVPMAATVLGGLGKWQEVIGM